MKLLALIPFILLYTLPGKTQGLDEHARTDRIALSISSSQTTSTADIAAYINSNFDTEDKKVRAAYAWVANNIKYDAAHLHRVILNEDHEEKVTWALARKKGVCENFAAIFTDICIKCGLRSYNVEGYTRYSGSVDKSGHAWSAVFLNNNWYLYDPTWDAGFIAQPATSYFQVLPTEFIQSHIPFDPMFQFLNYPLTYDEFSKGYSQASKSTTYFNYKDSIDANEKMPALNQYDASSLRIEKNGSPTATVSTRLSQLRMEREIIYQDKDADLYNSAVEDYKQAIGNFKAFLAYRNNQFTPAKPVNETESMLDKILKQLALANNKLKEVNLSKAALALDTGDVEKILSDLESKVKEQQVFLKNYLSTTK